MHINRLMLLNGGKRVMPCGRFLPGKFTIRLSEAYKYDTKNEYTNFQTAISLPFVISIQEEACMDVRSKDT